MKMDLKQGQENFSRLLEQLQPNCVAEFLDWVKESFTTQAPVASSQNAEGEATLQSICDDIRAMIPINAILQSENTVYPAVGLGSDCPPETTVHVDAFLYDDDQLDSLVEQNLASRHYCRECGCHSCSPLTIISHSISLDQLRYIFSAGQKQGLLPPEMTNAKVLVDVGSRLGAVLYGAYSFSPHLSRIIGVEINEDLCKLQRAIVQKYEMADKVEIVCDDILNRLDVIQIADFVVLHNTFQFFVDINHQVKCWQMLHGACRQGCVLITVPSVEELTHHIATHLPFSVDDWLVPVSSRNNAAIYAGTDQDLFETLHPISMYQVK